MKIKDSSDINSYKDNETKFNNYKTSANFFTKIYRKIDRIIKGVIERNIKISDARVSSIFVNLGKNYINKKTKNNFYSKKFSY